MNILSNIQSNLSRKARRFMASQEGFTLIELLVVVSIMGVLAVVIVPNVARFANRGQAEAHNTELKDIQTSIDALMADQRLAAVNDTAGTLAICDFSNVNVALSGCNVTAFDLDTGLTTTAYLFPLWNRTNPSSMAYCWDGTGLVSQVAKGATC